MNQTKHPFVSWFKISSLAHVIKGLEVYAEKESSFVLPKIIYDSKVKLHGTNAAISFYQGEIRPQSRSGFKMEDTEGTHFGFSHWVYQHEQRWKEVLSNRCLEEQLILFGEFCGKGIQKGVAVSQIDKCFFPFAAISVSQEGNTVWYNPELLTELVPEELFGKSVHVIPFETSIEIDFSNKESIRSSAEKINETVSIVEKCDPFIKRVFGVEGIGEGLVYYPRLDGLNNTDVFSRYIFKAKGPEHNSVRSKSAVVDFVNMQTIQEFVNYCVTESRLNQAVHEVCGNNPTPQKTGEFLKWINKDIITECQAELEVSQLVWKDVSKYVNHKASRWFKEQTLKVV